MTLGCTRLARPPPPLASASVSASYAQAVVAIAVARGADHSRLVAAAGIAPGAAAGPDARVAMADFKALMRAAALVTDDRAFGLHFGAQSQFHEISVVGMISHAAATMAEAFAQMNRYARLAVEVEGHADGPRFAIVERDGETWIEDRTRNPLDFPELIESTVARFIWTTKRFLGDAPFAKRVCFAHRPVAASDDYADILGVPVAFDCRWNAIAIHPSWLDLPLPFSNRYVFGVFIDRAEALLAEWAANTSVRGRLESALLPILHAGAPDMGHLAATLGMGRSTLYRRLRAEGAGFEAVLDALRHRSRQLAVATKTAHAADFC